MAGEVLTFWNDAAIKTLEGGGASVPSGSLSAAASAGYNVDADGGNYPDVQFILKVTFGTAPLENAVIALCAQLIGLDGSDADLPETTRPGRVIGTFAVNNVTTLQTLELTVTDVPRNANYYLFNANTGQAITAGWTLKAIPKTYKPGA